MAPIKTSDVLVQGVAPNAYLNKVLARYYLPYGHIQGLAFEFSDGTKINLGSNPANPYNTDPYVNYKPEAVKTINLPNGADKLLWKANGASMGRAPDPIVQTQQQKALYFDKNGVRIGQMVGGSYCCNQNGEVRVAAGQIISKLLLSVSTDGYYRNYTFKTAYGIPDPNAKPIDGGWSAWSEYGLCSKACGNGLKKRTRLCNNPPSALGGKDCEGDAFEFQPCKMAECPTDGGWGAWNSWSTCSGDCSVGVGTKRRSRACDNPAVVGSGKPCVGDRTEVVPCDLTTCPKNGGWGQYSAWGTCSAHCGGGKQSHTRQCSNPVPSNGGDNCVGKAVEIRDCNDHPCPINGGWSEWGEWGDCASGEQRRMRQCNKPVPEFGGTNCDGLDFEARACAIAGGWGDWTDWSDCVNGVRIKSRQCNKPTPAFGGKNCMGSTKSEEKCGTGAPVITPVTTVDPDGTTTTVTVVKDDDNKVVDIIPEKEGMSTELMIFIALVVVVAFFMFGNQGTAVTGGNEMDGGGFLDIQVGGNQYGGDNVSVAGGDCAE